MPLVAGPACFGRESALVSAARTASTVSFAGTKATINFCRAALGMDFEYALQSSDNLPGFSRMVVTIETLLGVACSAILPPLQMTAQSQRVAHQRLQGALYRSLP